MRPAVSEASRWCCFGDATNLLFATGAFEAVLALKVIKHIGVDYNRNQPTGSLRWRFAQKLARVGHLILLATPNRWFPLGEHGQNRYQIRFHSPFKDATLTLRELRTLIRSREWGVIPYAGYFKLQKLQRLHIPTRPILAVLRLFTPQLLRQSPLNPHLFVWFRN